MKFSMKAKRMQRHHNRLQSAGKLNLVSLMDIFTILVFFLMVNQSNVEVLQNDKSLKLPDSVAEHKPKESLIVSINPDQVLVQGKKVATTADVRSNEGVRINSIIDELNYHASRRNLVEQEIDLGRPVIIMADKSISYAVIKKVMASCAEADYRNISFAVNKVADKPLQENDTGAI